MSKFTRYTNVDEARVIQVVEVKSIIGEGVTGDPVRQITEYYDFDGTRLARTESLNTLNAKIGEFYDESEARNE
jgi:hypothetical protein